MNPIKHMAIIMDGNGRWGLKHKNSRNLGHKEGLKTVEMVIKYCIKKKIKFLTLYSFYIIMYIIYFLIIFILLLHKINVYKLKKYN